MRTSEVNKLINKHILPSLAGFGYETHKDLIYKLESNYFLKYYCIVFAGRGIKDLSISVAIQPLFVKSDFLYKTFGFNLSHTIRKGVFGSKRTELWDATDENLTESFAGIVKAILAQGEPFLSTVTGPRDFFEQFKKQQKDDIAIYEASAYSSILFADEQLQNRELKGLINFCSSQIEDEDDDEVEIKIREDASQLLQAGTTIKRKEILNDWAMETISFLKIPGLDPRC